MMFSELGVERMKLISEAILHLSIYRTKMIECSSKFMTKNQFTNHTYIYLLVTTKTVLEGKTTSSHILIDREILRQIFRRIT